MNLFLSLHLFIWGLIKLFQAQDRVRRTAIPGGWYISSDQIFGEVTERLLENLS